MLINSIMDMFIALFSLLTSAISIPDFPTSVTETLNSGLSYISDGLGIIRYFTHFNYLLVLLGIILAVNAAVHLYGFVMWVLRKIPFLSIE